MVRDPFAEAMVITVWSSVLQKEMTLIARVVEEDT